MKWAQSFAVSLRGLPLRERTLRHIRTFLLTLSGKTNVNKWQVDQAAEALRILYKDFLHLPWAQDWPALSVLLSEKNDCIVNTCHDGQPAEYTFRDPLNPKKVKKEHNEILQLLRPYLYRRAVRN